jgi:hypothetical protein
VPLSHDQGYVRERERADPPRSHCRERRRCLQQIREANTLGGVMNPVAGLGDAALWSHVGAADQLNVAQGRFLVIASADLGKGVATLEMSRAVAQRVLPRLPV